MGALLEDLGATIHPHPTLTEAVAIAANHAMGRAIDIMNR
jgi:dihydrolipoamide dehydrogenase